MSAYLYRRLSSIDAIPRQSLVRALGRSMVRKTSLTEALIALDVRFAAAIYRVVHDAGPQADESWRPDPLLSRRLPPGMCAQYLAYPFRERAGKIEVATVCPGDLGLQREFELHLASPVVLHRASLQALLAAAQAPIDFRALSRFSTQPPPPLAESALPLVRKSSAEARKRERTRTSPGIGRLGK